MVGFLGFASSDNVTDMKHIPQIKTVMTPFPYFIELGATLHEALSTMKRHRIRHLPVVKDHNLVGIITDRDIRLTLRSAHDPSFEKKVQVKDVFIEEAYTVDLTEPVDNVLLHLAQNHIGSALVTKNGRLAGLYTMTDACRQFGEFLREHYLPVSGDDVA